MRVLHTKVRRLAQRASLLNLEEPIILQKFGNQDGVISRFSSYRPCWSIDMRQVSWYTKSVSVPLWRCITSTICAGADLKFESLKRRLCSPSKETRKSQSQDLSSVPWEPYVSISQHISNRLSRWASFDLERENKNPSWFGHCRRVNSRSDEWVGDISRQTIGENVTLESDMLKIEGRCISGSEPFPWVPSVAVWSLSHRSSCTFAEAVNLIDKWVKCLRFCHIHFLRESTSMGCWMPSHSNLCKNWKLDRPSTFCPPWGQLASVMREILRRFFCCEVKKPFSSKMPAGRQQPRCQLEAVSFRSVSVSLSQKDLLKRA